MMKLKFLPLYTRIVWLLLAFCCYELIRQHIDQLFRIADFEKKMTSIRYPDPPTDITIEPPAEMTVARPNKYEKQVYVSFLFTRIDADSCKGQFEYN
jgi:hypothetical protein